MTIEDKRLAMQIKTLAARGIDITEMSSELWLQLALETESILKNLGPFDPAYTAFVQRQMDYEKAAAISELQGRCPAVSRESSELSWLIRWTSASCW